MRRRVLLPLLAAALLVSATAGGPAVAEEPTTKRLAGADRYATAAAIVRDAFPSAGVPVVLVASGEDFADALAGGPAAAALGGPVLPVPTVGVPEVIRAELARLEPEQILILGGPAAVSDQTATELQMYTSGDVTRVAGVNRYDTAGQLAQHAFSGPVAQVLVATGTGFADALAGGAAAATTGSAVLLVEPTRLPGETAAALDALQPAQIAVLGGSSAVTDAVLDQLKAHTTGDVTRLSAADRFGTAARVSAWQWPQSAAVVYLATGRGFADALSGVSATGVDLAPLLLVEPDCMPTATRQQLDRLQPSTLVVLGGSGAVSDAAAGGAPCPPPPPPCADVFPPAYADQLARDFPTQRVTASVVDTRTGCEHSLHPDLRLTTASVIKGAVLGAVLLQAQDAGRALSDWERARIRPMIEYSHNNPYVSDLYAAIGGVDGMDAADRRWGATRTTNSAAYGATWTTAQDRTRISLKMLHGGGPLAADGRAEAWHYMSSVHPTQRWGVSAGVPQGYAVALKNGFYPMRDYGWRVGSTGFVRQNDAGGGYAFTVLTDGASSQVQGMRLVEDVSRRVAALLAGGPPAPRSVDRAVCTTASSGESWAAVARRVGADAAGVRTVSGGNPSPLQGQRACSPTLRP